MKQILISLSLICSLAILTGCATPMIERVDDKEQILEIGYAFLVDNQVEEEGYGLYSYLLFGSHPTDVNRDLYLQAILACIKMPSIKRLEKVGFHRRELNATYIPILNPLPAAKAGISPDWVLENYDYARARLLLRNLHSGAYRNGPYIISTLTPLSSHKNLSEGYLHQDLSRIPHTQPNLVYAWVKEFLERVSRPGPKDKTTMKQFVIELCTAISIIAEHLPDVHDAAVKWLSLD